MFFYLFLKKVSLCKTTSFIERGKMKKREEAWNEKRNKDFEYKKMSIRFL